MPSSCVTTAFGTWSEVAVPPVSAFEAERGRAVRVEAADQVVVVDAGRRYGRGMRDLDRRELSAGQLEGVAVRYAVGVDVEAGSIVVAVDAQRLVDQRRAARERVIHLDKLLGLDKAEIVVGAATDVRVRPEARCLAAGVDAGHLGLRRFREILVVKIRVGW